jgi:tripartite-type tricarboxylate transporter receptor subunit TctC
MHRRTFASLLAAIAPLLASGHAWADSWPTKPLKLIVPYAAGGPTDAIARMIGTKMAASLGQPVVVDNRAGAGKTRAPQLPDVPTTVELGLPNVLMETTYGLIAPKGIPAGVQTKLREAAVAAINSPEMKERFLKQGAIAATSTPAEYRSLMQAESDKWRGVITSAKITLD